jgi:hypothetical protein
MQPGADLPVPEPTDDVERRLVADVRAYGWHAVHVRAGDHPAPLTGVPFAYTTGLWLTANHPEVVLTGDFVHAQELLAAVVLLVQRGERFLPGAETDGVLADGPVRFGAVDRRHHAGPLGYAGWVHRGRGFQAVQLLVPDGAGRWPTDEGYAGVPQPALR